MENKTINVAVVAEIATALKQLKDQVVFVGGAVVSLYTDDPAADEIRPTKDVDMTINAMNLGQWDKFQSELSKLNFHPDPFGSSICSFKYNGIPIDIMPSEDGPMGPSNRWYKIGFENLWQTNVKSVPISILSAPCYLATKFEAFNSRGIDFRTSHDIEDFVYIMDNRTTIVNEIATSDSLIKSFLKKELQLLKDKNLLLETLVAHIHPILINERLPIVQDKIEKILAS